MKALLLLLVAALVVSPARAQLGVQGGGQRDWIRLTETGEFQEILAPLAGLTYDVPLTMDGRHGISLGTKASQDIVWVTQYLGEYWRIIADGRIEWFLGVQGETWASEELLGDIKFLGGPRGGLRINAPFVDLPLEFSGSASFGAEGLERRGIFFGTRLFNDTPENPQAKTKTQAIERP